MRAEQTLPIPAGSRDLRMLAVLVVAWIALFAWLAPPGANDLVGGDEGYYGTMARNVIAGPRWLASPSLSPLGPPGDKPFGYPLLLSLSLRVFGITEWALRWPSYVLAGLTAFALGAMLTRAYGRGWGLLGSAMLLTLPWYADVSRTVAAEIPLTALGAAAVALATRRHPGVASAALAGALLGLAFLCKLWLVVLVALPAVAAVAMGAGWPRRLAALLAALAVVSSLHLVSVLAWRPEDWPHWLDIYFQRSMADRVAGVEFRGGWVKPAAFYWAMLARAFGLLLPLVAVGMESAVRRWREPIPRALLAWALGAALLSAFSVKSGTYTYPVVPAWAALAALGAWSIARGEPLPWLTPVAFAAASAPVVTQWLAGSEMPWSVWAIVWLGGGAVVLALRSVPRLRPVVAIGVAVLACLLGSVRELQRLPVRYHAVGYRAAAGVLAPHLASAPPESTSVLAPEAPSFSFYLFRTAQYWQTPWVEMSPGRSRAIEADRSLRAFVVDTSRAWYGGWPGDSMLTWLERSTDEVTPAVRRAAGQPIPLRVFVRR